jgi:TRAP-type C4-dicarboxylate transport system permease small subunit
MYKRMEKIKQRYLKFFNLFERISEKVKKVCTVFCLILLAFVTSEAGIAVFWRYVLNSPIQWAEEVARYTLIWLTMVAASIAIKERGHISLTTVVRRLSRTTAMYTEIFLVLIIICVITVIAKYSWSMVVSTSVNMYSPSIAISMVWAHSALPLGFALMVWQSLFILFENIKILLTKSSFEKE